MTRRTRRNHSGAFKAKVAMAEIKGDRTLPELAQAFDVHANQITQWRTELLESIGRKHTATLMKTMGICALYRRPSTSQPEPGHKIYPYLLRQTRVERANQAWAMDITSIPMAKGFVYLAGVIDWFTRRVLSWRLSIAMETSRMASRPADSRCAMAHRC